MEEKNKVCWNCGNFGAYYEKGMCRFYKTNKGMCFERREIVEKHGVCEKWRSTFSIRKCRKKYSLRALDEILFDIAVIRQILEEENEEQKSSLE